jgi:hypothetical protein
MLEKRLILQVGVIAPRRQATGTDDHLLTCLQVLLGILWAHEKSSTTANLSPLLNMRGATQVQQAFWTRLLGACFVCSNASAVIRLGVRMV